MLIKFLERALKAFHKAINILMYLSKSSNIQEFLCPGKVDIQTQVIPDLENMWFKQNKKND